MDSRTNRDVDVALPEVGAFYRHCTRDIVVEVIAISDELIKFAELRYDDRSNDHPRDVPYLPPNRFNILFPTKLDRAPLYCPRCGHHLMMVKSSYQNETTEWDDLANDLVPVPDCRWSEGDESEWYTCTNTDCFFAEDGCELRYHHPYDDTTAKHLNHARRPGDSWSLSWIK